MGKRYIQNRDGTMAGSVPTGVKPPTPNDLRAKSAFGGGPVTLAPEYIERLEALRDRLATQDEALSPDVETVAEPVVEPEARSWRIEEDAWASARMLQLSSAEMQEIVDRTEEQEAVFGRNNGTFTARVDRNYTAVGVAGEIAARRMLIDTFGLAPDEVRLGAVGDKYDLYVTTPDGERGVHVKTGAYKSWPNDSLPFGIHAKQGIQQSGAPVVLVLLLRDMDGKGFKRNVKIAGWIPPWHLGECPIVEAGQSFPGVSALKSRTRNIATMIRDYQPITDLGAMLGPHPAERPAEAGPAVVDLRDKVSTTS